MNQSNARYDAEPFEMIPHWLLFDPDVSATAIRIWLILRKHRSYETGQCWPGRKRLATLCGVSVKTVDRELPKLAEAGAITIMKRKTAGGDADTNLYHVHWDRGGVKLSLPSDKKGLGGGVKLTHEQRPINNKEEIPLWISEMEDGPEHTAAYLAFMKGQTA